MAHIFNRITPKEDNDANRVEYQAERIDDASNSQRKLGVDGLGRFGLCSTCYHVFMARSELRVRQVFCTRFEESGCVLRLSSSDPITECTSFSERTFQPSLNDMYNLAIVIEVDKKKAGMI